MSADQKLEKIIENHIPTLKNGQQTLDSVLKMYPKEEDELRPRLEAALWLAKAEEALNPHPSYIPSTRNYLEKRISSVPPHNAWQRLMLRYTPPRWIFNIVSPVLLIALVALVINSLVLSARLSIPGDPLYSSKLAIEDIQLAFTLNAEDKSDLYIQFSRERTTEFVELVLEGDYGQLPAAADRMETEMVSTLHSLNSMTSDDPVDRASMIASLKDTYTNEIQMLNLLKETSPSSAHPGIDLAIQVAQTGSMALH